MTPILGFAPDADPTTPGVLTDCANLIPYINGMESGPSASTPSSTPALASECMGAAVLTKLSGTRRVIAGAATKLYELTGGAWADQSGGTYNATTDFRWSFCQFGDTTLAANKADTIQRSPSTTFAAIAGAPKADIIFSVGSQVMALNVNDGTDKPDGWHVCAINDETDWTASLTTQAAKGRLVTTPGAITAGGRLGEYAGVYKAKSLYLGRYVGGNSIWDFQLISDETGCAGKEAWCAISASAHLFVGEDNIWLFDGTRPVPFADGTVRQWLNDNCNPSYRYRIKCVFDRPNNRVWIFFPSNSATTCDSALVYHVTTKKWGRADRSIQAALSYIAPGLTYDTWSSAGATYDTLPSIPYDSQFWVAGGQALSIFNTSHQLQTLNGASGTSSFTTGDVGDDFQLTLLDEVRLRFAPGYSPTSATLQVYSKFASGNGLTAGASVSMANGKFTVMQEALWHRGSFSFTGPTRVIGMEPKYSAAGEN